MGIDKDEILCFKPFELNVSQRVLERDGETVRISPKAFELLVYFARHPNEVISKERLMGEVWRDTFVEDANLAVHVSNLRKVLHSDAEIETFPKKGYKFNAVVISPSVLAAEEPPARAVLAKGRKLLPLMLLLGAILIVATGGGWLAKRIGSGPAPRRPTVERLHGTSQSVASALSPNGEFLVHAISKNGKRSVELKNLASGSTTELIAADRSNYKNMAFGPDGSQVYFSREIEGRWSLYKMPILGGSGTKLIDGSVSKISFSPDGLRFCFIERVNGSSALKTSAVDGTDHVVVATRQKPEYFDSETVAWSPNGDLIAALVGVERTPRSLRLVGIESKSGQERSLSHGRWNNANRLEWIADDVILAALQEDVPWTEVWTLDILTGRSTKLTSELRDYAIQSVTADGTTALIDQFTYESSLWIQPGDDASKARPVPAAKLHQFQWVKWTKDGRLVFASNLSTARRETWIMDADGGRERRLTGGDRPSVMPVITPDGRFVVYSTNEGSQTFHLWRADANTGANAVQLTRGIEETRPDISPDGRWVFYTEGLLSDPPTKHTIWKVPIEGGEAVPVIEKPSDWPDVSPDGKFLLGWYKDADAAWKVGVFPIEGGEPIRLFDGEGPRERIHWTPDGTAFSYTKTVDEVTNIWTQPLNGGPPDQVTTFTSQTIMNFDWSDDWQLVCSRQPKTHDLLLFKDIR